MISEYFDFIFIEQHLEFNIGFEQHKIIFIVITLNFKIFIGEIT